MCLCIDYTEQTFSCQLLLLIIQIFKDSLIFFEKYMNYLVNFHEIMLNSRMYSHFMLKLLSNIIKIYGV